MGGFSEGLKAGALAFSAGLDWPKKIEEHRQMVQERLERREEREQLSLLRQTVASLVTPYQADVNAAERAKIEADELGIENLDAATKQRAATNKMIKSRMDMHSALEHVFAQYALSGNRNVAQRAQEMMKQNNASVQGWIGTMLSLEEQRETARLQAAEREHQARESALTRALTREEGAANRAMDRWAKTQDIELGKLDISQRDAFAREQLYALISKDLTLSREESARARYNVDRWIEYQRWHDETIEAAKISIDAARLNIQQEQHTGWMEANKAEVKLNQARADQIRDIIERSGNQEIREQAAHEAQMRHDEIDLALKLNRAQDEGEAHDRAMELFGDQKEKLQAEVNSIKNNNYLQRVELANSYTLLAHTLTDEEWKAANLEGDRSTWLSSLDYVSEEMATEVDTVRRVVGQQEKYVQRLKLRAEAGKGDPAELRQAEEELVRLQGVEDQYDRALQTARQQEAEYAEWRNAQSDKDAVERMEHWRTSGAFKKALYLVFLTPLASAGIRASRRFEDSPPVPGSYRYEGRDLSGRIAPEED